MTAVPPDIRRLNGGNLADWTIHSSIDGSDTLHVWAIPADGARPILHLAGPPLVSRSAAPHTAAVLGPPATFAAVTLDVAQAAVDEAQTAGRLTAGYEDNVATEAKRKRRAERAARIAALEAEKAALEAEQGAEA